MTTQQDHGVDLEATVQQIMKLDEVIEDLKARRAALVQSIVTARGPGKHDAGDLVVSVRPGARRLDAARFASAYPVEKYPSFYKATPDTKAARDELGANKLDQFYGEPGAPVVSFK